MFCSLNQLKQEDEEVVEEQRSEIPKEPLFEKPLTPSDVGKLNRLVIPKHHALKYFPLTGVVESGEINGLLLGFEDEVGKSWRFRYSYWNSSQSYVLTKGWSRFVKEKKLDAGDIVLFERHRLDCDRLFIGWRRRDRNSVGNSRVSQLDTGIGVQGRSWSRVLYPAHPYPIQLQESSSLPYQTLQPHCLHNTVLHTQLTTASGKNNSKTLRLFGVNLEFQLGTTDEPP